MWITGANPLRHRCCRPRIIILQDRNTKTYNKKEKNIMQLPFGVLVRKSGINDGMPSEQLALSLSTKETLQFNMAGASFQPALDTQTK